MGIELMIGLSSCDDDPIWDGDKEQVLRPTIDISMYINRDRELFSKIRAAEVDSGCLPDWDCSADSASVKRIEQADIVSLLRESATRNNDWTHKGALAYLDAISSRVRVFLCW